MKFLYGVPCEVPAGQDWRTKQQGGNGAINTALVTLRTSLSPAPAMGAGRFLAIHTYDLTPGHTPRGLQGPASEVAWGIFSYQGAQRLLAVGVVSQVKLESSRGGASCPGLVDGQSSRPGTTPCGTHGPKVPQDHQRAPIQKGYAQPGPW